MDSNDVSVAIIVAQSTNRVIGNNNELPWRLPQDLKYFKKVTMGKPILMGRKTYDSIGRPLPGRKNIVITRQPDWCADGVTVAGSLSSAIVLARQYAVANDLSEVMIIGGAQIYEEALGLANKLYLTQIHAEIDGDAFFPKMDGSWGEIERTDCVDDSPDKLKFSFVVLQKNTLTNKRGPL